MSGNLIYTCDWIPHATEDWIPSERLGLRAASDAFCRSDYSRGKVVKVIEIKKYPGLESLRLHFGIC